MIGVDISNVWGEVSLQELLALEAEVAAAHEALGEPAQTAPITLKNVLNMLRDCFRCYWFIDDQNRFRVEHIQFFRKIALRQIMLGSEGINSFA